MSLETFLRPPADGMIPHQNKHIIADSVFLKGANMEDIYLAGFETTFALILTTLETLLFVAWQSLIPPRCFYFPHYLTFCKSLRAK